MDQYHDNYHATLTQVKDALPEFIKNASLQDVRKLPESAFAFPERRQFPIHTPEETLVSTSYFFKKAYHQLPKPILKRIYTKLAKAAYSHEVEDYFLQIVKDVFPQEKKASIDDPNNYALLIKEAGKAIGRYYIGDAFNTKLACDHFVKNHKKYPLTWRREICRNLVKRAQDFNIGNLHPVIRSYTGDNVCLSDKAADEIAKRAFFTFKNKQISNLYKKYATSIRGNMTSPDTLEKAATVLDRLDKATGLDKFYGTHFEDPYKTIFNLTKQGAEQIIRVVDILGNQFSLDELSKLDPAVYQQALGQDFIDEVLNENDLIDPEKLKQLIPTLPRDEKGMLLKHLKQVVESQPDND